MPAEIYLGNVSVVAPSCIDQAQYLSAVNAIIEIQTDNAIKLGAGCFIAGMFVMWLFDEIDRRWKK